MLYFLKSIKHSCLYCSWEIILLCSVCQASPTEHAMLWSFCKLHNYAQPPCLQECLETFVQTETLTSKTDYSCRVCKYNVPATKHVLLSQYPKVLVIHLRSFSAQKATCDFASMSKVCHILPFWYRSGLHWRGTQPERAPLACLNQVAQQYRLLSITPCLLSCMS